MIYIGVEISSNNAGFLTEDVLFYSFIDENIEKKHFKCKKMEIKNITSDNIITEIADFIYQVYEVFNNKYEATPIKIQKLIFISEMVSRKKYGKSILPEDIFFECNKCGFRIPRFDGVIKDYISVGELKNERISPTIEETTIILNIVSFFSDRKILNSASLEILYKTIFEFGKCYPHYIGEILNEFKINSENVIFSKTPPFSFGSNDFNTLLNNIENIEDNPIASFIINYGQQ